ncbi:MAG: hypothetical protein APF84_08775 [Gracilibacter sp. BRH_c7a]|nr:MAG: hypothetical protein APF84_08775 [Gracilibacter sp. BRH_c7a]
MKRFLSYFLYTLLFLVCLIVLAKISYSLKDYGGRNFDLIPLAIYNSLSPIIIGFMLAIPQLVSNLRQSGKVTYDWTRALAIGLPTLFIGIGLILLFLSPIIGKFPGILTIVSPEVRLFGSMLFGYSLLTSIKKKPFDQNMNTNK